MLRFILHRDHHDGPSDGRWHGYETVALDVPELEALLKRGGLGEGGYDLTTLIGVEIIHQPTQD